MKAELWKAEYWVPVTVFLGVSIPLVLLLNALDVGGEYRIWIAIVAGGLATAWAQARLRRGSQGGRGRDSGTGTEQP